MGVVQVLTAADANIVSVEIRAALMPGCVLLPWDTAAGRCRACGDELSSKKRTWCGSDCRFIYERNHYWTAARAAAVIRDGFSCVKCGWREGEWYDYYTRTGQMVFWTRHTLLRRAPENWLEVNHIAPRRGQGYTAGCWNHQSNLETLCHKDHVKVTKRQRIDRARAS